MARVKAISSETTSTATQLVTHQYVEFFPLYAVCSLPHLLKALCCLTSGLSADLQHQITAVSHATLCAGMATTATRQKMFEQPQ